jgi:NAD(P)H-hydrate epimerase
VAAVRDMVARTTLSSVVDADGLYALGTGDEIGAVVRRAGGATGVQRTVVLTPHEGEFTRLAGAPPGADHVTAATALAQRCGAVVLLKGPTTVVAEPGGRVLLAMAGSPRLATAGTGDVLSGAIGAFMARGVEPQHAAALAAHVHGRAAELGPPEGLVAGDLAELMGRWLSGIRR